MPDLKLFIPITKYDERTGEVFGTLALEEVDKSNEIMDYEGSKPLFQEWTDAFTKATNGASAGNMRAMHQPIAAGKFTQIVFNDARKAIEVAGLVVDPVEREKTAKGVYTGFSLGGKYEKRWDDPDHAGVTRYIARPSEGSLVDNPAMYGATFAAVKADGAEELRKFLNEDERKVAEKAADAGLKPQDTPMAVQKWLATDGSPHDTKKQAEAHSLKVQADAEAAKLAEPATKALAALGTALDDKGAPPLASEETDAAKAAAAADDKAKAKDDKTSGDVEYADPGMQEDKQKRYPVDTDKHIRAAWSYINKESNQKPYTAAQVGKIKAKIVSAWKDKVDQAGPPEADKAFFAEELRKGLYAVGRIAELLETLKWLKTDIDWEAAYEKDGSPAGEHLQAIIDALCTFLVAYATEEANEAASGSSVEAPAEYEGAEYDVLEMAAGAIPHGTFAPLLKFVTDTAAATDAKPQIKAMAAGLAKANEAARVKEEVVKTAGADDDLAKAVARADALAKTLETVTPQIDAMTKRLAAVESMAAPPKGSVRAVSKTGTDNAAGAAETYKSYLATLTPQERAHELMKLSLSNPVPVIPAG